MKKYSFIKDILILIIVCVGILGSIFLYSGKVKSGDTRTKVTIAVCDDYYVKNFNNNYYTNWLEEQTGYNIEFVSAFSEYEKEYLTSMLNADNSSVDAVFLPNGNSIYSEDEFYELISKGQIERLNEYIDENSSLKPIIEDYPQSLSMNDRAVSDIWFIPQIDTRRVNRNMQVLWINMGWLKKLSLQIPQTTEELADVLTAFKTMDPNENGLPDEIPLVSNNSQSALQTQNFLLNAFILTDVDRLYLKNTENKIIDVCTTEAFREGLIYCNSLLRKGLLSSNTPDFSEEQLKELINSDKDLVGAFTCHRISDVIYPDSSEVLARYIQVPPLKGPNGEQNSVLLNESYGIGGYIPSNAIHKKEAFEVMELMMTKEASLISAYGEQDVDWRYSESGELSSYGNPSSITTINYLPKTVQNKHFNGAGPYFLPEAYSNDISWNGENSLMEYLDARAARVNENHYSDKTVDSEMLNNYSFLRHISKETSDYINDFIYGRKDIYSDEEWSRFVRFRENGGDL